MVDGFEVPAGSGKLRWRHDGKWIEADCPGADPETAVFLKRADCVGVLFALDGEPERARLFAAADGTTLVTVEPPTGFAISHLTNHPNAEAALVCGSLGDKVDGSYDWHFAINLKDGSTKRMVRSH